MRAVLCLLVTEAAGKYRLTCGPAPLPGRAALGGDGGFRDMRARTSSVIKASLLAEQRVDQRFSACCRARVENVLDRLLVEPDQGDHDFLVAGEPADEAERSSSAQDSLIPGSARHDVSTPRGAGRYRRARRILRTVASLTL